MRYEALRSEIRACMVLNTSDGKPSITICGNLDFPNMLGNSRARAFMPACCVCGRLCGGARSCGYRYHLKIKQEYFYSGS